jgi:uncharacterized delta-60 repeat protein
VKRLAVLVGLALVALGLLGVSSAANRPLAGSVDRSFAHRGTFALPGREGYVGGIAVQSDQKIVVAGGDWPSLQSGELNVVRLQPNGSRDPTFGTDGVATTRITPWAGAEAVALQPDRKIIVAGVTATGNEQFDPTLFLLVRYRSDGSLDPTFGNGGVVTTDVLRTTHPTSCWGSGASTVTVLHTGKILVGGYLGQDDCVDPSFLSFALAEYNSDGSLNTAFGNKGVSITSFTGGDSISRLAVAPDGKIVAVGYAHGFWHEDFDEIALAKYRSNGSLDTTFGDHGRVTTGQYTRYDATGLLLRRGGRILLSGWTLNKKLSVRAFLARFLPHGQRDRSFGHNGFLTLGRIKTAPFGLLAQRGGKAMVLGDMWRGSGRRAHSDLALIRVRPDGSRDPSFGTEGLRVIQRRVLFDRAVSQPDGRILVGGEGENAMTVIRVRNGNNCVVPGVTGKTLASAQRMIRRAYCRTGAIDRRVSHLIAGHVVSQSPARGARLPGGSKVNLVVSKGKRR